MSDAKTGKGHHRIPVTSLRGLTQCLLLSSAWLLGNLSARRLWMVVWSPLLGSEIVEGRPFAYETSVHSSKFSPVCVNTSVTTIVYKVLAPPSLTSSLSPSSILLFLSFLLSFYSYSSFILWLLSKYVLRTNSIPTVRISKTNKTRFFLNWGG